MHLEILTLPSHFPPLKFHSPKNIISHTTLPSFPLRRVTSTYSNVQRKLVIACCISPPSEGKTLGIGASDEVSDLDRSLEKFEEVDEELEGIEEIELVSELEEHSIWDQMKEIVMFTGPAIGLWLCGPLMSLIDTAVIGQGSSIELAALGPATVLCDYTCYVFMFLSIATSNMVATSLAKQDKFEVQHRISTLLLVGLACGVLMLVATKFFSTWALTVLASKMLGDL